MPLKRKTPGLSVLALLSAAVSAGVALPAAAALVVGEQQFNPGDVAPSPIVAVSTDLLQTSFGTASGENGATNPRNGSTGTALENTATNPAQVWGSAQTTYTFASSAQGYNIQEIRLFSGWMDGRAGQSYSIEYSLQATPASFVPLGTVSAPQSNGSLLTRTYNNAGGNILSGVAAIRFNQIDNGLAGTGTVFREIDILGTPTPEPGSLALLTLASAALLPRRRRPT